ncbi:MAG TPA: ABC transporter ATP-binding protein [Polaromonas sp.]|jgi:putative spermidine/putrescine transport system ATP-binding protein|uniref:ABC transporter ATP-binding protein n=1 Tax=unclassified Polaromonas TaxID=2638319 RepID=UPI000BD8E7D4|nr:MULTISPECIES: ABC transporter ATP-binding protein [unclassified Polaromonas]OYY32538.1 MAG: Fe3+/spermidine/putrescine ABC transporter ATP-binding protein [Polaromonas sp. 35-63-35]OYZ14949.1 MAG: Fe3+/spermidine/putrescine ABC transporter ATP-binding protein [Polaromonas sp. 16-63-31]OYZ75787.1 MAG: Fe3+/spermidine/putrescine ABC transporter ATP-binding protein [Polaromonas sp. 24-63-21]OZA46926.1 MAG: Fe3+/spermidine/putrescine ABC transporter ATP-binding protein [Polaromonas sp. 17-63-33]
MEAERTRVDIVQCAKTYADGTRGLQPTSLSVEPGEVLALLGPSGCGKTTLLRLVAGLEVPDAGSRISFGDTEVTHLPVEQRGIGMVFQHYALFPQMTVEANIGYGLRVRGTAEAEKRRVVGELIDLVRLNGLEKKRPAELSGGQRQRVALARAVAVRPRVLLLDEPLTALDAKLKESVRDELAELLRRLHITAIHVTHDQQEALAIADRLAVMQAGRIVQVGDGEALYRTPQHPFVASFLGRVNRLARDEVARAANVVKVGSMAVACPPAWSAQDTVLVRPEDIEVADITSGWCDAMVAQRVFLGDRIQLKLMLPDQTSVNAEVGRDHCARMGDAVGIRIQSHHLMPGSELTATPS